MNRLQKYAWIVPALALLTVTSSWPTSDDEQQPVSTNDEQINKVAQQILAEARQVFRFDTFGLSLTDQEKADVVQYLKSL